MDNENDNRGQFAPGQPPAVTPSLDAQVAASVPTRRSIMPDNAQVHRGAGPYGGAPVGGENSPGGSAAAASHAASAASQPATPVSAPQQPAQFGNPGTGVPAAVSADSIQSNHPVPATGLPPQVQPGQQAFYAPSYAPPGGFPNPDYAGVEQREKRSPIFVALIILLVLAVVTLGGLSIFLLVSETGGEPVSRGESASSTATPGAQTENSEADPSVENTVEPSEKLDEEAKYPPPAEALKWQAFTTKSGNTTCSFEGNAVRCQIAVQDGAMFGCTSEQAATVTLTEAGASGSCIEKSAYTTQGAAPEYGQSVADGDFACTSQADGTYCWSTRSGKGFKLARQEFSEIKK